MGDADGSAVNIERISDPSGLPQMDYKALALHLKLCGASATTGKQKMQTMTNIPISFKYGLPTISIGAHIALQPAGITNRNSAGTKQDHNQIHKAITAWQRKHKITAMQQHAGLEAKLDLSSVCVWGCLAYVHIDVESRRSKGKVVPRAVKGIWAGFDQTQKRT